MTSRTISVVIPSFNRPSLTERAIRSVLDQDLQPLEIIVVDDASDPPLDAAACAQPGSKLCVLRLDTNRGAAGARQAGIDAARGELIAFLDSDDVWLPGKLSAQMRLLEANPEIFRKDNDALWAVACGWRCVSEAGLATETRIPKPAEQGSDFVAGCWFSPGSTLLLPRQAFERVGGFSSTMRRLEDYEWFLRFGVAGGQLHVASCIGAEISIGRRASFASVERARNQILATDIAKSLPRSANSDLHAYLALEMAKAALNDKQPALMAYWLLRSLWRRPRLQLALRRWWV